MTFGRALVTLEPYLYRCITFSLVAVDGEIILEIVARVNWSLVAFHHLTLTNLLQALFALAANLSFAAHFVAVVLAVGLLAVRLLLAEHLWLLASDHDETRCVGCDEETIPPYGVGVNWSAKQPATRGVVDHHKYCAHIKRTCMALTEKQLEWTRNHRRNASPDVKEARRKRALERYHERREQDLPKMRQYSKKRFANDRRLALFEGAKRRAKLGSLPFTITIEDIVIPHICPVLGIPITTGLPANSPNLPSLDRFVPDLGYIPGNVTVISLGANSLKRDALVEEVALLHQWMLTQAAS